MVERIEGFCSEAEWKRAYQEINEMESHMANAGAVVESREKQTVTSSHACATQASVVSTSDYTHFQQ